jgi:hypothetical protein
MLRCRKPRDSGEIGWPAERNEAGRAASGAAGGTQVAGWDSQAGEQHCESNWCQHSAHWEPGRNGPLPEGHHMVFVLSRPGGQWAVGMSMYPFGWWILGTGTLPPSVFLFLLRALAYECWVDPLFPTQASPRRKSTKCERLPNSRWSQTSTVWLQLARTLTG